MLQNIACNPLLPNFFFALHTTLAGTPSPPILLSIFIYTVYQDLFCENLYLFTGSLSVGVRKR